MSNVDSDVKDNCIGEMRFLKAFSYFMLTRAYGEIPLFSTQESFTVISVPAGIDADAIVAYTFTRSAAAAPFDACPSTNFESVLLNSRSMAPCSSPSPARRRIISAYTSLMAARGLFSDSKAATYAENIIEGQYGNYSLLPYDNLWKRGFYNKTEHMFMLCSVSGDEKYGTHIHRYFSGQQDGR